jgi:DNA-binding LacI/PurR family transcriptional regulator
MNHATQRHASYREIARRAGVSVATVSLALSHHPRITASTRQKVVRIARALAYTPKKELAQIMGAIRRKRPELETLALVTNWPVRSPWKTNVYMRQFHETITRRASELGYQIEEFWMNEPGMNPKRLPKILHARNIPGLIIPPAFIAGKRLPFDVSAVAVASHGRIFWQPKLNRVEADVHYNTLLALKKMSQLGYRRIGLLCLGNTSVVHDHQIESAYSYYQSQGKIESDMRPFLRNDHSLDGLMDWLHQFRPESLLSTDPGVLPWLKNAKLKVPHEIGFAVMGVIAELGDCAGINVRPELLDAALVEMVVSQITLGERGIPMAPRATIIEGIWQSGGTLQRMDKN